MELKPLCYLCPTGVVSWQQQALEQVKSSLHNIIVEQLAWLPHYVIGHQAWCLDMSLQTGLFQHLIAGCCLSLMFWVFFAPVKPIHNKVATSIIEKLAFLPHRGSAWMRLDTSCQNRFCVLCFHVWQKNSFKVWGSKHIITSRPDE